MKKKTLFCCIAVCMMAVLAAGVGFAQERDHGYGKVDYSRNGSADMSFRPMIPPPSILS